MARKLFLPTSLAIVAAVAIIVGAIGWRLSRGPLTLPLVTPWLEEGLSQVGRDSIARVGRTELVWLHSRPEIRVVDFQLLHSDGAPIVSFPELSVWPSLRAAIRGKFAVARIGLSGARLSLMRLEDGRIAAGAGGGASDDHTAGLLAALIRRRSTDSGPSHLWRIDIRDAQIVLDDRSMQAEWRADRADLHIRLRPGGVAAQLATDLTFRGTTEKLVRELAVALTATTDVTLGDAGKIESLTFDAHGQAGRISSATDAEAPIALHSIATSGRYSADSGAVELRDAKAAVGAAALELTARLPVGAPEGIAEARGAISSLPVPELMRLWPPARAGKVHEWITENVREGFVPRAKFNLRIPYSRTPGVPLPDDSVDVTFDFEGLHVDYLKPLDPLSAVRGSATLTAARFDASVESAVTKTLEVRHGHFGVDLRPKPAQATVTADVTGAVADMLAFISQPPLELPQKMRIPTSDAGGDGDVHLGLRLPLARGITTKDVGVTANAKVHAARLPNIVAGIGVEGGELRIHVVDTRFEIEGETGLTGAPAIESPVSIALAVEPRDAATAPTRLHGAIEGRELLLEGEVALDVKGLKSASLATLRFGRTDLSADVARDPADQYRVSLDGETLDLEPLLTRERRDGGDSILARASWEADVRVTHLLTGMGLEAFEVGGHVIGEGERVHALNASGSVADGGTLDVEMKTEGDDRHVTFASDQGGKVVKALGINANLQGGRLAVVATVHDQPPGSGGRGEIEMSDFRVLQAPLLAQILSLGSLDGLAQMLGREGIGFTRARVPFSWTEQTIELHEARAVGAIGVSANGAIERDGGDVDIDGQVFPAYTLNSALGKVPLIGEILVGGVEKGVFGFDYSVSGTRAEPRISVNPISVLAPGILRRMFVEPFTQGKDVQADEP